ncbi:MAG: DUF1028 domain-containing protein [Chloroflexia bacterium]
MLNDLMTSSYPFIPATTYSILAHDPDANQWGVAVQSHYFGTGRVVTWAEAGVGAVATQSMVEVSYGPLGLSLMRAGKSASQSLSGLLAADPNSAVRQVAMIDAQGNVAAHTGAKCIDEAGHRTGNYYSVQANMMLNNTVWVAMSEAYESASGDLAERMMLALEAAEDHGGDIRGKQSAAMLVVGGNTTGTPWQSRLFDLRVDDNPTPLVELRRLLGIGRAYALSNEAAAIGRNESLGDARFNMARAKFEEAMHYTQQMPGNMEIPFWTAVELASLGQWEAATPLFKMIFSVDPAWRELIRRLPKAGRLSDSPEVVERIISIT